LPSMANRWLRNQVLFALEGESRGETCGLHNFEPGYPSQRILRNTNQSKSPAPILKKVPKPLKNP